ADRAYITLTAGNRGGYGLAVEAIDIAYARNKFGAERYPFAPALRPIREALAKLDPKRVPQPPAPEKPYVPSLVLQQKNKRPRGRAIAWYRSQRNRRS